MRLTLRSPLGFKPQIACDENDIQTIASFLKTVDWQIITKEDEAFAAQIDDTTKELVEEVSVAGHFQGWADLRFVSQQKDIRFKTDSPDELTNLFQAKGWCPV